MDLTKILNFVDDSTKKTKLKFDIDFEARWKA